MIFIFRCKIIATIRCYKVGHGFAVAEIGSIFLDGHHSMAVTMWVFHAAYHMATLGVVE